MKEVSHFKCLRCGEDRSHYCLGMCNRCYQRHLREKNKDRKINPSGTYSYKRKKNNYPFTSPHIGESYQTAIPEMTKTQDSRSYTKAYKYEDQANVDKFLKYCKMIFSEYPAEGDIIKGACGIEERALNLLEQYGDMHKAMYAVKNPIALALNPELIDSLSQEEIEKEVNQVWSDLHRVKIDSKDEFLEKMKVSVENGITEQELQTLLQLATNMKVKVPKEITNELTESENFSKGLRKKLVDRSLGIEELREIVNKFADFKVKTVTMQHYQDLLIKADEWIIRFNKLTHPTMRQLQSMVSEGSGLPLNLPELSIIKEKHKSVKKWTETVHVLIKSWRCKKDVRTPLSEVQGLVQEAKALQFSHHDIQVLEEATQKVFEWQEQVRMAEEDIYCSDYIIQLLEEGQNLPLEVDSLECMKNTFNWTARAKKVLEGKKINQKVLAQLANEGKNKNISNPMLKEMQVLLNISKTWRDKVKKALSNSNTSQDHIQELLKEGESFHIDEEPFISQLKSKLTKISDQKDQKKSNKKSESSNPSRPVKKQPSFSSDYEEIKHLLKFPESWTSAANYFIKKFPRIIPSAEDLPTLKKLIEECPAGQKSLIEYLKLTEMLEVQQSWTKESNISIEKEDLSKIHVLISRSQHIPVDLSVYERLTESLASIEWKTKAAHLLKIQDIQALKQLKIEVPGQCKNSAEFTEVQNSLEKYEEWANELEKVCEDGNVENLEEIYKASKNLIISHEQRTLIKRSLFSIYSWKARVRYFLMNGGEISEGRALAKEGEYVCFECSEQEDLTNLLEKLKLLKKKARKVLTNLPNSAMRSQVTPRIHKKKNILEEYKLESSENQIGDLIQAVEYASDTLAPMEPHAFPLYHPIQGLSLIISIPTLSKPVRVPEEKKKRPISYKQMNEDGKNVKRPPRRPKNFEISRQSFCICKNEASWNDTIMINCDYCGEWYHPSCISIDSEDIDKIEEFCCFLCYERIGIRSDRVKRQIISHQDFLSLVQECTGQYLCDEIREVHRISERISDWRIETKELLNTGLMSKELKKIYETDSTLIEEQQYLFDAKIMKSLVEYEGLPVIMEERDNLLILLRKRDWLREAYQSIYKKNSYRNIKKLIKERCTFEEENFTEAVSELQKILGVIQEYNSQLQDILKGAPTLPQLKKFFENEEIMHYKLDLFEKTKKKVEQFESIMAEIREEILTKDRKRLPALVAKAEKLGIKDGLLDEAAGMCS